MNMKRVILSNNDEEFKKDEDLPQEPQLKRFTKKQLEQRARISEKNIEKGEVYSQEDVEKMSQNW